MHCYFALCTIYLTVLHHAVSLNVLITSVCLRDNYNSIADTALELHRRNHKVEVVLYGSCISWAEELVKAGISVTETPSIDLANLSVDPHDDLANSYEEISNRFEIVYPQTHQEISSLMKEKTSTFDVILSCEHSLGTLVYSERQAIPAVVSYQITPPLTENFYSCPTINYNCLMMLFTYSYSLRSLYYEGMRKINILREAHSLSGRFSSPAEYHTKFYIAVQGSPNLLNTKGQSSKYLKYVGYKPRVSTSELEEKLQKWIDSSEKSIIFISLGLQTHIDFDELVTSDEIKSSPYRFLYSLNLDEIKYFSDKGINSLVFEHIYIMGFLTESKILSNPKIKYFVSNCDGGSLLTAFGAGIPTLCRPGYGDQIILANLVTELQLGNTITGSLEFTNVNTSVVSADVLYKKFKSNVGVMKSSLSDIGGYVALADYVEQVQKKGVIPENNEFPLPFLFTTGVRYLPQLIALLIGGLFIGLNILLFAIYIMSSSSKRLKKD